MKSITFFASFYLFIQAFFLPIPNYKYQDFSFFIGVWKGKGEFHNGKPIEATLKFEKSLDNRWIISSHKDFPPNKFEAISLWPLNSKNTEDLKIYMFDSFGSHRKFSTKGWVNDEVVLISETDNEGIWKWQKFKFSKTSDVSFKMVFEVSPDGEEWMMIDYLNFVKSEL